MLSLSRWALMCLALLTACSMALGQQGMLASNQQLQELIKSQIAEKHDFYGLAVYLNQVTYFTDDGTSLRQITDEWVSDPSHEPLNLLLVGRYQAAVLTLDQQHVEWIDGQLHIKQSANQPIPYHIMSKKELSQVNSRYEVIRYHQLWRPLALLAVAFENTLGWLGRLLGGHWGLAIFLFALLIKLILLPLSIATSRSQQKVSQIQAKLLPQLREIKANFDGEQAHNKMMAAHKQLGVTPFFTLKPLFLTLLQIPFLIAIFNVLGEMLELQGAGFLWVSDLSLPDMVMNFGFGIPLLGESLNLMPFVMTLIATTATVGFKDENATAEMIKNQKIRLHLMAAAFFVLFYPFPAAMVYYWAMANLLQLFLQRILK